MNPDIARLREVLDYCGAADREAFERVLQDAARPTAPPAAQLDADNLPPPSVELSALTDAITAKVAEFYPQQTPRDMEKNQRLARAILRLPLLRQVINEGIAPYAERIRLLEREKAKRGGWIGSVGDYTQFHVLLNAVCDASQELDEAEGHAVFAAADKLEKANHALIAYIDGRTAGTASDAAPEAEAAPTCWCRACNKNRLVHGLPYEMTTFIVCPECGNKRCPRASDHALACTGSNEPGQPGSVFAAAPSTQEGAK